MCDYIESTSNIVSVHLLENTISTGHGLNVDFILKNGNFLKINNQNEAIQPTFDFIIHDPTMIGLDNSQENNVEQFIDDVILTCNIVLNRVSLSKYLSKHNKTQIKFRAHKSISKVYDTPEGKVIKIHEHISIHDGVSISVGVKDELDENKVLDILQKIRKIRKGNSQSILNVHNFSKSLREYDLATKSTERLSVFKH